MADDQESGVPADFAPQQVPPQLGPMVKWGLVILGLILLFALLNFIRSIYTDLLWYDSLDLRGVFVTILRTRILMFVVGALVFGGLLSLSLYFAHRHSTGPVSLPVPPEVADMFRKLAAWGSVAVVVILSVIFGAVMATRWEIFLRFTNSVSFGETDPVFDKDISFYVFTVPILDFTQGWLLGAAIIILLTTVALYFVNFSLRGGRLALTPALKIHVSIIAAILLFILAWGYWLDRWGLLLSDHGAVFGAAYADLNARKPALLILTLIASAGGVLILVNAYLRGMRLLVGGLVLWLVMAILLGGVWPGLMQQVRVNPNEFAKEAPYIDRNIEFTRRGFGLRDVEEVFFPAESAVTDELVQANLLTVNNIRLWDYRPLSNVYKQIQLIRPYYDFRDADVDRYTLGGQYRQVLLSAREVAPEKLTEEAQTWVNLKLVYTHGIGIAMSPATDFTPEGRPEFFAKDIPLNGVIPIGVDASFETAELIVENPRIYYGENTIDYVIVNTNTDELDYATQDDVFRNSYSGVGGVRLGSFLRRVAYAWQFADPNILISGEIHGKSLIQYRRQIQERISTVAPFLMLDSDPYIVAAEGKLFWVQDAYTTSDHYPYSDPRIDVVAGDSFNYIRNSVKVVVSAFDGTLDFYIWDTSDPVVMTYKKIFPDLFLSKDQMPASLQEHVRYPQDLFTIQAEKYIRYHMKGSEDFYNNEDLWAFSREKLGQSDTLQLVEPYFVIMKLPGEEKEEFVQLLPYTPNERQNLIGWLAARSDGENYGKLVAFNFPKDRQIDGPEQVEARIDNDRDISAWFTLRCSEGSICIRGNLLVIPVGESILYAEPIYIQATGVTFPELKQVILATGEKVVMENSLAEALEALTGGSGPAAATPSDGEAPGAAPASPASSPVQAVFEGLAEVVEGLKEDITRLEETLESLKELTGGE